MIFAVLLVISLKKQRKKQKEVNAVEGMKGIFCVINSFPYRLYFNVSIHRNYRNIFLSSLGASLDEKVVPADEHTRKSTDSNYIINQNYKVDLELQVSGNPYYCTEIGKGVSQVVESATEFPQNIEVMKTVENVYYE